MVCPLVYPSNPNSDLHISALAAVSSILGITRILTRFAPSLIKHVATDVCLVDKRRLCQPRSRVSVNT
jgi:hypothetical protein